MTYATFLRPSALLSCALLASCASGGDRDGGPSGTVDSSTPGFDAGPATDSGPPPDAGPRPDAGLRPDAGPGFDAGGPRDSGFPGVDSGGLPGLDAGGLICTSSADCTMAGTCCLRLGSGPGFCVPGMEIAGICIPSG